MTTQIIEKDDGTLTIKDDGQTTEKAGDFAAGARKAAEELINLANQAKGGDVTPAMAGKLGSIVSTLQAMAGKMPKAAKKEADADGDADTKKADTTDTKVDKEADTTDTKVDKEADADTKKADEPTADADVDKAKAKKQEDEEDKKPAFLAGRFTPAKKKAVKAALKTLVDVMSAIGIMPPEMKKGIDDVAKAVDEAETDDTQVDKADDQDDQIADLKKSLEERDTTIADLGKRLDTLEKAGVSTALSDDGSAGDIETKKADRPWGGLLQLND